MKSSRNFSRLYRGVLEQAGLGEFAYFLNKAKHQLTHAKFALENSELSRMSDRLDGATKRVKEINNSVVELQLFIQNMEREILGEAERNAARNAARKGEKKKDV